MGSHKDNVGILVKAILELGPQRLGGKYVVGRVETFTAASMLELWSEATGKAAAFVQISLDDYEKLWPSWGTEMALMYLWWDKAGRDCWVVPGEECLTVQDLGLDKSDFVSTRAAMLTQNWDDLC